MTAAHVVCAAALALVMSAATGTAQQEFPPPQGKGRVVVVASGQSGPAHYTAVSQQIAQRIRVPVLMFAGGEDSYKGCCLIGTAHTIADAAKAAGKPFELVTYADAKHDFVYGGENYNANDYKDALQKTATKLKEYLGN